MMLRDDDDHDHHHALQFFPFALHSSTSKDYLLEQVRASMQ